jgi:hypothetical protein
MIKLKRRQVGEMRNIFYGKPEGKRPLGRPRCIWEDNIKMYLKEMGWDSVDWILLAQHRDWLWALVKMIIILCVP